MLYFVTIVLCFWVKATVVWCSYPYFGFETSGNASTPEIFLTQDGPVTLDMPITFVAQLNDTVPPHEFLYMFEDNVDPARRFPKNGTTNATISIIYPDNMYRPGDYIMTVTCLFVLWKEIVIKIASASIPFTITEYISGKLNIAGVKRRYDKLYAATGDAVNMSVSLQLPSKVFQESELTYSWTIKKRQFITSKPFISYRFKSAGSYNVRVATVARITLYNDVSNEVQAVRYKWGYFNDELEIKDPFNAINLTGNTYLKHGEMFELDVACDGSGPFEYCWKVVQPSENLTNFRCLSPVITTTCSFPIVYYFNPSGDYHIAIFIDNYVTSMQRELDVHINDVSLKPQLSTVIIPILCSVIVIIIIAAGIVLHVRCNQQIDIETADFDFLQSETCASETFWEHLYHSIIRTFWLRTGVTQLHLKSSEKADSATTESVPESSAS